MRGGDIILYVRGIEYVRLRYKHPSHRRQIIARWEYLFGKNIDIGIIPIISDRITELALKHTA